MFGWSDLEGTLDAVIEHDFETAGAHDVSGNLSLSAVSVKVPELDRPAIQFDKLSVALDKIDVVKQHAAVADVALSNLRLVADPKLPRLMLVLRPPKSAEPEPAPAPAPATGRAGGAAEALDVEPGARPARERAARRTAARIRCSRSASTRRSRSSRSPAKAASPVSLTVSQGNGKLALTGALALEPLGFDGKLTLRDFALAPLAVRAPVAGGELLRGGKARADLAIALAPRAGVTPPAADLRVSGSLGLAGAPGGEGGRPRLRRGLEGLRAADQGGPRRAGDGRRPRAAARDRRCARPVPPRRPRRPHRAHREGHRAARARRRREAGRGTGRSAARNGEAAGRGRARAADPRTAREAAHRGRARPHLGSHRDSVLRGPHRQAHRARARHPLPRPGDRQRAGRARGAAGREAVRALRDRAEGIDTRRQARGAPARAVQSVRHVDGLLPRERGALLHRRRKAQGRHVGVDHGRAPRPARGRRLRRAKRCSSRASASRCRWRSAS